MTLDPLLLRYPDLAALTDYQLGLYAAAVAERERAGSGFGEATKPDRPPTEDEYVALSRAMWGWSEADARAAYRRQVKGGSGG